MIIALTVKYIDKIKDALFMSTIKGLFCFFLSANNQKKFLEKIINQNWTPSYSNIEKPIQKNSI